MKYQVITSLILISGASSVFANSCGNLNDYQVTSTSFSREPVGSAVKRLFDGTPFKVTIQGNPVARVSASGVEGSLDGVLTKLGAATNFSYSVDRCNVTVKIEPPKVSTVWQIKSGDRLKTTLAAWAGKAGWQLSWEMTGNLEVGADAVFPGTFEDAVDQLFQVIAGDSRGIKHHLYAGNKVLRVYADHTTLERK